MADLYVLDRHRQRLGGRAVGVELTLGCPIQLRSAPGPGNWALIEADDALEFRVESCNTMRVRGLYRESRASQIDRDHDAEQIRTEAKDALDRLHELISMVAVAANVKTLDARTGLIAAMRIERDTIRKALP